MLDLATIFPWLWQIFNFVILFGVNSACWWLLFRIMIYFLPGELSLKSGSNLFIGMLFLLAWLVETNVTSTPMSQLTIVLIYVIILLSHSQSNGFILIMVCCTCDQTQPHTINAILMSNYSLTVKLLPSLLILYIISILLSFCVVLMHWSLKSVRCCCR